MNLPSFVFPYHRSPSSWNTPDFVLTHTMPLAGGTFASMLSDFVDGALLLAGGFSGAVFAADGGAGVAAAPPTVTSGVSFWIVLAETPAFDKSCTDVYGRPAMIFFAVAGPTPGSASSSFSVAELTSTFSAVVAAFFSVPVPLGVCAHALGTIAPLTIRTRARSSAYTLAIADSFPTESHSRRYSRPCAAILGGMSSSVKSHRDDHHSATVRACRPDCCRAS